MKQNVGNMPDDRIKLLKEKLRNFAKLRDWEQFHSPKNLAMALAAEAGELLEEFQWLTEKQSYNLSSEKKNAVADEIGDIQIYLIRLSDQLGIDPLKAAEQKLKSNELKYPVEKSYGTASKYTEWDK